LSVRHRPNIFRVFKYMNVLQRNMRNKILVVALCIIALLLTLVIIGISMKPKMSASEALALANRAVSIYGIVFDEVIEEAATTAVFVSGFVDCDFSNYGYDWVWMAEKDIGEREISGISGKKQFRVSTIVYIGFDGRVCKAAKLMDVIPGIISIDRVILVETPESIEQEGNEFFGCPANAPGACGVDGKTYSNSCVANRAGIEVACEGPCPC